MSTASFTGLPRTDVADVPEVKCQTTVGIRAHSNILVDFEAVCKRAVLASPASIQIGAKIGRGRQGVVYRGTRHGARQCVTSHAVKFFDPNVYSSIEDYWSDMTRISEQVSRLHSIDSPNLVTCGCYNETHGTGYLEMTLIEGTNLKALVYRNDGDVKQDISESLFNSFQGRLCIQPGIAVEIMRQMLSGLESLHNANYLHRDIKPSNTMIDAFGYVKLIDLGRATHIDKPSGVLGTPHYMAPEIHARLPATVQSDIYSVGLVGLALLTGEEFGHELHSEDQLLKLKLHLPEQLERCLPDYVRRNSLLISLLNRMLHPSPASRFESARAAESSSEGLSTIHHQMACGKLDTDYRRALATHVTGFHPRPVGSR